MISCTRRIQFAYGHRVMRHESKCRHLHGHNGVVLITAEAEEIENGLDGCGRVIDFSVLKEKVGGWIDQHWDHGVILNSADLAGGAAVRAFQAQEREIAAHERRMSQYGASLLEPFTQKVYWIQGENPTAEVLAAHLLHEVCPRLLQDTGVRVTKVVFFETENCSAEASL